MQHANTSLGPCNLARQGVSTTVQLKSNKFTSPRGFFWEKNKDKT